MDRRRRRTASTQEDQPRRQHELRLRPDRSARRRRAIASLAGEAYYAYDANGNRTNAGYQTGPDNGLPSDGTYNYTYDGEGNLIKRTEIATGSVESTRGITATG